MRDDTISRQAAIDALDVLRQEHRYRIPGKRETYSQYNEAWQDALDRAEGAICNLPSAQPERPKGQWMLCDNQRREDIENGNYMYVCTNCLCSDVHAKTVTVPFCWHCGAEMRGEQDG